MAFADSNRVRLAYIAESAFDTTPATPTLQILRLLSSSFAANKETAVSNTLRSDRMVQDLVEVGFTNQGQIDFELSLGGSYDDFIQAALGGTWSTAIAHSGAATFTASTDNIEATSAFTNATVGQWIFVAGSSQSANNGWHQITTVTDNDNVIVSSSLADATDASGVTIKGSMLRNGTTLRSFSIEQAFLDIGQYHKFSGQRVGSMSLNVEAGSIVTGSFGLQGATVAQNTSTYANSTTAATTTSVLNATSNVGTIIEGGSTLSTALQAITLNLDNGLRNQMAIASKYPQGIGQGRQTVTGSIRAYFEDETLYTKFLNHTYSSLVFDLSDAAGNRIHIELPRIQFMNDAPSPGGIDQDIMEDLQFQAVANTGQTHQIQIDMVAA